MAKTFGGLDFLKGGHYILGKSTAGTNLPAYDGMSSNDVMQKNIFFWMLNN